MAEENPPASKKDFKSVIDSLASTQAVAAEKRRKADQIKYNTDQARLVAIAKELQVANATKTLELEQEKAKIQQERSAEKIKQESGSRNIEIQRASLELQKAAIEAAGGVAEDNQDYRDEVRKQKLADLAQRKLTATSPAALKEINREERAELGNYFQRFLGKDSRLASGLNFIGEGLKAKVKGGLEGIFKALKTGAFVAVLIGLSKFLQSKEFENIKDKYLPAITKGLKKLGATLKSVMDGFFVVGMDEFGDETYEFKLGAGLANIMVMIGNSFKEIGVKMLAAFYPPDGNGEFSLTAGLKDLATNVGLTAAALLAFSAFMRPGRFFGTAFVMGMRGGGKLFGGTMRLIASGFGLLFPYLTGFSTSLTKTGGGMADALLRSQRSGGAFDLGGGPGRSRRGRGILGKFGKLFSFLGKRKGLVGLLIGAGVGMSTLLTNTDVFSGISNAFGKMFDVLRNLGAKIANTAAKAAGKIAKTVTDFVKPVSSAVKIGAEGLAALRGTGKYSLDKMKLKPKFSGTGRGEGGKAQREAAEAALKNSRFLKASKTVSTISEAALKKSFLRASAAVAFKMAPVVGIFAGGGLAIYRALMGDFKGAAAETVGMFAPSVVGLPIDLAIMARDMYKSSYTTFPEDDAAKHGGKVVAERMLQITDYLKKQYASEIKAGKRVGSQNIDAIFDPRGKNQRNTPQAQIDTSSLSTARPPDFVTGNTSTRNLSGLQMTQQGRSGGAGGTLVNAPVTNFVDRSSNSNQKTFLSTALTIQDPIVAYAISAM